MSIRRFREWNLDCKVYIGNLSESASKQDVESVLSKYGPLKNIWVARNPPGFAFVEYEDPRDADDAVRALDGTRICGSRVRVEKSHGRSKRNPPSRRYGGRDRENGRYYPKSRRYSPVRRRSRSRTRSPPKRSRYSRSRSHSRSRSRNRSVTPRSLLRSPRSPPSPKNPRSPRSPPPRSPMSPVSQILVKSPKNGHRDDDSRSRSRSRSITPDD